jgi:hypothetical protein
MTSFSPIRIFVTFFLIKDERLIGLSKGSQISHAYSFSNLQLNYNRYWWVYFLANKFWLVWSYLCSWFACIHHAKKDEVIFNRYFHFRIILAYSVLQSQWFLTHRWGYFDSFRNIGELENKCELIYIILKRLFVSIL